MVDIALKNISLFAFISIVFRSCFTQEASEEQEAWYAAVHMVPRVRHDWTTEQQQHGSFYYDSFTHSSN